jgi:hypothetical protein
MKSTNQSIILAIMIASTAISNAAIVIANSAAASFPGSNGTVAANMIDGKLAAKIYTTLTEANKNTLVSNNGYGFVGSAGGQFIGDYTNGQTITFTFTDQTIGGILLWNYSQNAIRGIDAITTVEVMTDGVNWVNLGLSKTLSDAGTANFQAQTLDLGSVIDGVGGIRLTLAQGFTGGGAPPETAGGFDEVAFSSVPEPSTSVAFLGGLAALALRRRRA